MPERTDNRRLKIPSLDVLWAHLRAQPHLLFTMRVDGKPQASEYVEFIRFQNSFVRFHDGQGRPVLVNLRGNDPRGYEWGIRLFTGGFRFRKANLVMTFKYCDEVPF